MKSIKPGRGPSMMSGVVSILAVVFGIFWTIGAASMGAPLIFPLFGLCFIGIGVGQAIYHFRNATGKDRYSSYDVVDSEEEPDPLNQRFGASMDDSIPFDVSDAETHSTSAAFCPYCGTKLQPGYEFCPKCGKKLPD